MSFNDVLYVLLPIYMNAHGWNVEDSVADVYERKRRYIYETILVGGIKGGEVDGDIFYDFEYTDDPYLGKVPSANSDEGPIKVIHPEKSYVNVKSLLNYVMNDLADETLVPIELRQSVGISVFTAEKSNLEVKYDSKIDKLVCQGIARALWDIEPNMTLKEMTNHNAIQTYGNGCKYKDPKTLPGWLSEVDPRPEDKRRGPKKRVDEVT